jgi:hypothetical protein
MREPSLIFLGLWFDFLQLRLENYNMVSWKKKEFEDLEDSLVYFRLYFVIAWDNSYISTMYSLLFYKYTWFWLRKQHHQSYD